MAMLGSKLTKRVRRWLEAAEKRWAMNRFGGVQQCPWCKRWMQLSGETYLDQVDAFEDEIHCGHCTGTSFWRWELGFIFIGPGDPPKPEPYDENLVKFMAPENASRVSGLKQ